MIRVISILFAIKLIAHVAGDTTGEASCTRTGTQKLCDEDIENKLLVDLFKGYRLEIRPVRDSHSPKTEPLKIQLGLQLTLLVTVDERNQIMQTNIWMLLAWHDYQLVWSPDDYNNITELHIPPDKVWLPDIVLFNNADGVYEPTFFSNVVLSNDGNIRWVPPAIFKSSCIIDVEHFPFDEQRCTFRFGSWTYEKHELDMDFYEGVEAIDLSQYCASTIWDVVDVPATINRDKNRIDFILVLRRKALFYTWVLLIPTVLMAFLSCSVFYVPTNAKEKIGLSIYILVSIDVFLLLVSKILPPTSKTVPLMAKYLLMTLILNVITILTTVIVVNVHYRSPNTHVLPNWMRTFFLNFLTKVLLMRRPRRQEMYVNSRNWVAEYQREKRLKELESEARAHKLLPFLTVSSHHPNCTLSLTRNRDTFGTTLEGDQDMQRSLGRKKRSNSLAVISPTGWHILSIVDYITDHMKSGEETKKTTDDWKYVAMVIDRLLMYVFVGVTLGGTLGIFFTAPNLFDSIDQERELRYLKARYRWAG